MSLLPVSAIPVEGGYNINNSLRFRNNANAYLNRTLTNSNTSFTLSLWIKRGKISTDQDIFGTDTSNFFRFTSTDTLSLATGNGTVRVSTTAVYRDPSAWYHIVLNRNGVQAGTTSVFTIYVNNQSVGTYTGNGGNFTSAIAHYLGARNNAGSNTFDGYFAEVNYIDGQALTPSSFGETNTTTGVWQPKAYTGTYGTNGFYLKFADASAATAAAIGKDSSGNGNNWTPNNISVTAGSTYDAMTDSPTLTSDTVANYPVINPLYVTASTQVSIINGNLTASNSGAASSAGGVCSFPVDNGKWYWEVNIQTMGASMQVGVIPTGMTTSLGKSNAGIYAYHSGGTKYVNGVSSAYGASYTAGDTIGMTYDSSTGVLTAYKNNTSQGTLTTLSTTSSFTPYLGFDNGGAQLVHINFGQRPFTYTPPTGYTALNTFNLPTSTILEGDLYMDATLYTGTGASRSVTNAAGFRPDFVWVKGRSGATDHALYDAVRGTTNDLVSNSTAAATTQAQGLTAFNSNGFTVGTLAKMNTNAATYVGWQWQAGSSTVTNTSGTISAQVRANTTTGFSIVTYTGNGTAGATIGHGLGVAPRMIFVKTTNAADNWAVYHSSIGATNYLQLNTQNASAASTTLWNDTSPTSTVFSVGTNNDVNDSARTYVAYCWAEIAGFSKFGSYTGNGNVNGPFVYLGFRPKFILFKNTSTTSNWVIEDSGRNTNNVVNSILIAEANTAETTGTTTSSITDFLSNGFKLRGTGGTANGNGNTIIYAAFAENPFKNALAR